MYSSTELLLDQHIPLYDRGEIIMRDVFSVLSLKPRRIVAFGGSLAFLLRCACVAEKTVYIDNDPATIEEFVSSFRRFPNLASKFEGVCSDLEQETMLSGFSFEPDDVVLFLECLHHLKNPGATLRRVYEQVLAGRILVLDGTVELMDGNEKEVAAGREAVRSEYERSYASVPRALEDGWEKDDVKRKKCRSLMQALGFENEESIKNFLAACTMGPYEFSYAPSCPCPGRCGGVTWYWFASFLKKEETVAKAA